MNLIFLGAGSSGKGTQAKLLCGELGLSHIATGDILRQAVAEGTEFGRKAKPIMDLGNLVPDEIVIGMVAEHLSGLEGGVLFDGFPRTEPQAHALDTLLLDVGRRLDRVIFFNVPEDVLVQRAANRWLCSNKECQQPHSATGACSVCGSPLYQREDDREETVRNRLNEYHQKTEGLLGYYRNQGMLVEIDGVGALGQVSQRILDCVKGRVA